MFNKRETIRYFRYCRFIKTPSLVELPQWIISGYTYLILSSFKNFIKSGFYDLTNDNLCIVNKNFIVRLSEFLMTFRYIVITLGKNTRICRF